MDVREVASPCFHANFMQNKLPVKFGTCDFSFSFEWLGN